MQATFELGEEANAYEQLVSAMEKASDNAELLSEVYLDMLDDGKVSSETLLSPASVDGGETGSTPPTSLNGETTALL